MRLLHFISLLFYIEKISIIYRGGSRDFEKVGALCRPPWLAGEENLGFRWSKKAEITLETLSFWQNISIGIFKFSRFLSIKSCQFLKFTNALIRKEKKHSYSSQ